MSNFIERLKAMTGHPSEEYVSRTICELLLKATQHPGKTYTKRYGVHRSASVIVPKRKEKA